MLFWLLSIAVIRFNILMYHTAHATAPTTFTDKCNEAITNAFKQFWLKEQVQTSEDNKTGVAICFSYLRYVCLLYALWPQWQYSNSVLYNHCVFMVLSICNKIF